MLKSIVKFQEAYNEAFKDLNVRGVTMSSDSNWQVHMSLESLKEFYKHHGRIGTVRVEKPGEWALNIPEYGCVSIDLRDWASVTVLALFSEGVDISEFL